MINLKKDIYKRINTFKMREKNSVEKVTIKLW